MSDREADDTQGYEPPRTEDVPAEDGSATTAPGVTDVVDQ